MGTFACILLIPTHVQKQQGQPWDGGKTTCLLYTIKNTYII
jgi:hypothetical protein